MTQTWSEMVLEVETGIRLTSMQRKMAALGIKVPLGKHSKPGWGGALPFYAFNCKLHGVVINYPQGYAKILRCPECDREESQREATKRTDPKMNVLADEPETAKSVRPTQVKKSEREIRESKKVR